MWISQNEMENQNDNDMWLRLNKLNINDDNDSPQEEVNISKGFVLFATSSSRMSHLIGDARIRFFGRTISKHSPLRRYYLTRNSFKIVSLSHIPIAYKIREFFLILARIFAFYLVSSSFFCSNISFSDFLSYS